MAEYLLIMIRRKWLRVIVSLSETKEPQATESLPGLREVVPILPSHSLEESWSTTATAHTGLVQAQHTEKPRLLVLVCSL